MPAKKQSHYYTKTFLDYKLHFLICYVVKFNFVVFMVFCLLLDSGVGRLLPAPGNSDYGRQADCCPQRSGQPVVRSNFRTVVIRIQIWIWFPSCFFLGKTSIINYCKLQFYSYVKCGEFWPLITWIFLLFLWYIKCSIFGRKIPVPIRIWLIWFRFTSTRSLWNMVPRLVLTFQLYEGETLGFCVLVLFLPNPDQNQNLTDLPHGTWSH